jgi:hypothetical protein
VAVNRRDPLFDSLSEAAKAEEQARDDLRVAQRRVAAALRDIKAAGTSSRLAARVVLRAIGSPLDHALVEREAARIRKKTRARNSVHQNIGSVPGERATAGAQSVQEAQMDPRILTRRVVTTETWIDQPPDFDADASDDEREDDDEQFDGPDGPAADPPQLPTGHGPGRPRRGR